MTQYHTNGRENSGNRARFPPAHEPSFEARPVPGRSGFDSLLVPEPSPRRRLHSDPVRAGTSRAPDAGGFRGARRAQSSGDSLQGERVGVRVSQPLDSGFTPVERVEGSAAPPIGVCFSGGIDSGSAFLVTYHVMRKLGMNPSRLKAFTLNFGDGPDFQQAREFLD